jgi:hypothetical protein
MVRHLFIERRGGVVNVLPHIWEVPGTNLSPETSYRDRFLVVFLRPSSILILYFFIFDFSFLLYSFLSSSRSRVFFFQQTH